MTVTAKHWIAGAFVESADGAVAASIDPARGASLGEFAAAGRAEARQAVAAARTVFDQSDWPRAPLQRAAVLLEFARRMQEAAPALTRLLTAENGKILRQSAAEIAIAVSELRYYAGLARTLAGRIVEPEPGLYSMLSREPMGVAGIIVPWNAPVILLIRSLAPAIAAGCTAVIKAAPQTALTHHAIIEILAGIELLPAGAVNSFSECGGEGAKELVASPDVDVLSYTGSTVVGKKIMAAAAGTLKRLNLELGGSAPCVLFEDADLAHAVPRLVAAGLIMSGQQCVAASRLLVHESLLEDASGRFTAALGAMRVGPGDESESEMGPMIDVPARDRILDLIAEARGGVDCLLEGRAPGGRLAAGAFVTPSLLRIRDRARRVAQEEIFGPILTLDSFADEADAVHRANDSRFGLAASVWTRDLRRAQRVASRLRAGTVWINAHGRLLPEAETGGYKESGLGRLHGVEGLGEFLQTKNVQWDVG